MLKRASLTPHWSHVMYYIGMALMWLFNQIVFFIFLYILPAL